MSKQKHGARGERGPAGPAGPIGARGPRGATGKKGTAGRAVPLGRKELLTAVEGEIETIHSELQIQMTRMAQIQAQVDSLRSMVRQLTNKPA